MSHEQRRHSLLNVGTVLLGILLVVAAIGTMISVSHTSRVGSTDNGARGLLGTPLRISTLEQGAINCPYGAAFSPDGNHLVVLGSLNSCASGTSTLTRHVAAIYDSHSGVMTLYVRLETLLGIDSSLPLSQQPVRAVSCFNLGWSPDGNHIAIIFTAFTSADVLTPETVWDAGLIIMDAEHGTARVLHGDSGFFPMPGTTGSGFPIWNIAGAEVPEYSSEPGLAYAWNARGEPYPIVKANTALRQLPITAGPRYPIGNPDGNSTFTIWQPGVILGSDSNTSAAIFTTVFPTWSPDGTYVTLINAGARLPLAQPTTQPGTEASGSIAYPTPSLMPSVPARDTALVAVQRRAGTRGWALVAWNPAGTLLASINCNVPGDETLELRATDSAVIQGSAALPLADGDTGCRNIPDGASAYPAQPMMLLWAPSGDRVVVCDQKAGTLTIWPVSRPVE
ncbi:MAG TPA: hypothetical protein VFU63_09360 [Ktedonobacterales bacterium]|nr:hypothetical protein [Ktedonobacterales bacterium]